MTRLARNIIGTVGVLALCEFAGRSGLVNPAFLPPPSVIGPRLVEQFNDNDFSVGVVASVQAWLVAILIAIAIAVPVGVLFGSVPLVRSAFSAIVEFLRPIPSVALIPLAIVAITTDPEVKISLAVFGAVWPILFNTMHAMGDIEPVKLPSIMPFVLTGVRISAAIALILIISTEVLAGGKGLGVYISETGGVGRMDLAIAGTFVAGVIGVVINLVFVAIQRRWVNWSDGDRAR
jgi:NitT/TauT family transport system permease protein